MNRRQARPKGGLDALTDRECAIARRYAGGRTYKEIARELADKAQAVRDEKDEALAKTRGLLKVLPVEPLDWVFKALGFLQYDLNLHLPGLERDGHGYLVHAH